jgi:hypothetical protein
MFGPDDFSHENMGNEVQDYKDFNSFTSSIGDLIYLTDFNDEQSRYKFMLSLMNIFFFNSEVKEGMVSSDNVCDFILALGFHLCVAIQTNPETEDYKQTLQSTIVENVKRKMEE